MVESVLRVLESVVISHDQLGLVAERHGNDMPLQVGAGVFATRDGAWISLTGGPHAAMLARLFDMIGRPGESSELPWSDPVRRVENRALLHGWIATWAAQLSRAEAVQAGVDFQVPVAPVNTVEDVVADSHVRDRGAIVTVDDPDLQSLRMQGVVPLFSRTAGRVRHAAPVAPEPVHGILAHWDDARTTPKATPDD